MEANLERNHSDERSSDNERRSAGFDLRSYDGPSLFDSDEADHSLYLETIRGRSLDPEESLMLAVLQDAVSCFQQNFHARTGKKRQLFLDAEAWIFGQQEDHLFGFETVCEVLRINAAYLRRGLRDWGRNHRTTIPCEQNEELLPAA